VRPGVVAFDDRLEGYNAQDVERSVGDFVLLRADGSFAYQLAVVVDDMAQGITDVVRGLDLLDSTPRQILIYEALGVPPPRYMHLPLALNARGEKLSKQTLAPPLDDSRAAENIREAARCLGLDPPVGSVRQTLDWCILRR
jgi:glutamyl-Q tRNA(Asp) synthetase